MVRFIINRLMYLIPVLLIHVGYRFFLLCISSRETGGLHLGR